MTYPDLPPASGAGPTVTVPVAMSDDGLAERDAIEGQDGTQHSRCPGYRAMAVTALTGHGDPSVLELLPAAVSPSRATRLDRG